MDTPSCRGCLQRDKLLAELQAQVERLTAQVEEVRRKGKRQAAPFSKKPPKSDPKKPGRKPGKDYGAKAQRQPPPPEQIDEFHDAPLPECCPHCGGADIHESEVAHQYQTEIPRQPVHRQFNIHIGHCQGCGKRLQGRHELQTSDALGAAASQLGPDVQSAIVTLNKDMGLSHGKITNVLDSLFGIDLSRGGSVHTTLRVANRCQDVYEDIREEVRLSEVLWPDETGWRVGGGSSWLHAWVSPKAICYEIDRHRSADALERLIGLQWSGIMHHDGYATYDRFENATHQQCLAHILHRARDLLKSAVAGAVHFPRKVIRLFTEAIDVRKQYDRGERSLQSLSALHDDLELRLLQLLVPPRVDPAYTRLSNHLWNHFDDWLTFLREPLAETTNNRAERAIRPAVVNRKVWGGNRTWPGAKAQSILMSVLQTCRQQAIHGLDFVSNVLRGQASSIIMPTQG